MKNVIVVRCFDSDGIYKDWFKSFPSLKEALAFMDEAWMYGWECEIVKEN